MVRSASIAKSKICDASTLENRLDTEAAAATQHAEEEPSPAPIGMSD